MIWSAPHALGIAGALLLSALAFLVVEYETDVPQFDALWYLPVLATGSALALGIVRLLARGRWSAAEAAGVYLALIAGVTGFLLLLGFDAPQLPLLVVPAALLDLADRRGAGIVLRATLYVGALYAVYVPVLDWLGEGVEIDPGDVLLGLPIALVGVSLVFAALLAGTAPRRAWTVSPALAGALGLALLLAAAPALAHDPGQGAGAGVAALEARLDGRVVRLGAWLLRSDCARFRSGAMIARRSARELRVPMQRRGCRFRGRLRLDERGRWFLYAALRGGGEDGRGVAPGQGGRRLGQLQRASSLRLRRRGAGHHNPPPRQSRPAVSTR